MAHYLLSPDHLLGLVLPGQPDPRHRRHELRRVAEEGGGGGGGCLARGGGAEGEETFFSFFLLPMCFGASGSNVLHVPICAQVDLIYVSILRVTVPTSFSTMLFNVPCLHLKKKTNHNYSKFILLFSLQIIVIA